VIAGRIGGGVRFDARVRAVVLRLEAFDPCLRTPQIPRVEFVLGDVDVVAGSCPSVGSPSQSVLPEKSTTWTDTSTSFRSLGNWLPRPVPS
jgi:hypothetical protein